MTHSGVAIAKIVNFGGGYHHRHEKGYHAGYPYIKSTDKTSLTRLLHDLAGWDGLFVAANDIIHGPTGETTQGQSPLALGLFHVV